MFTSPTARPVSSWPILPDHDVPQAWFQADFSAAPLNELQRSIVGMVQMLPQARALGLDAVRVERVGDAVALMSRVSNRSGAHPTTPREFWRPRRRRWPWRLLPEQ